MADLISMLAAAAGAAPTGEYQIERSLRFNSADSAYLNRTPASAGNRKTWTYSCWVKRGFSDNFSMFAQYTDGSNQSMVNIRNNTTGTNPNTIRFYDLASGSFTTDIYWSPVYRDYSAWYHVVIVADTTQATNTNRIKLYVNGTQITSTISATWPSQNTDLRININASHFIGQNGSGSDYADGYLTEINFIDGQALTPSSFGEFNPDTGVWSPIKYAGTYGTNGFYLNFSDNSDTTATTLGKDYSGNGNNWTPNNFSVTAGAGNDSLVDSPTRYGTDTGAGGNVRGNYCTLNPLKTGTTYKPTLSEGNLKYEGENNTQNPAAGTIGVATGKWYFEATVTNVGYIPGIGVTDPSIDFGTGDNWRSNNKGVVLYADGTLWTNASSSASGYTYTTNDIIGIAFDADTGKVWIAKNNNWFNSGDPVAGTGQVATGSGYSSLTPLLDGTEISTKDTIILNCGQRPFAYTAPSGFKALVTTNLPNPTIVQGDDYFNTVLYTGNGSTQSITGVGFQPDWVWLKSRSNATDNELTDAVRGATKSLVSNSTAAEATDANGLTAFNSDGFSLGTDANYNGSTRTFVAWNWKANGAGSSNTAGTIASTVSVNTTAGISIVTYTGTGANATVGHGLGVAPKMVIVKNRSLAGENWRVWHTSLTDGTYYLNLNTTGAQATNSSFFTAAPTTTLINVGTDDSTNKNGNTYVGYCFAAIPGFSAFGSYTGNGSADGPFIFCNFRPRFVMIKGSGQVSNWQMLDTARNPFNPAQNFVRANSSNAEASLYPVDINSNGFKIRTDDSDYNTNAQNYIYMAFSTNPFKFALAR